MQYTFDAKTVDVLRSEIVRFLRYRADKKRKEIGIYKQKSLKLGCETHAVAWEEIATDIEQAQLVKEGV